VKVGAPIRVFAPDDDVREFRGVELIA